jgi:hypothetical protein
MNTCKRNRTPLAALIGASILMMTGLVTPVCLANSANISCGAPRRSGTVTVKIKVEKADGSTRVVTWSASIDDSDSSQQKAAKIRAAAPATDPDVIIGGQNNSVSATSQGGSTIKSMGLRQDNTHENDVSNVFAVAIGNHFGLVDVDGDASGEGFGSPGSVIIGVGGQAVAVATTQGMTAEAVNAAILNALQDAGISSRFAQVSDELDDGDFNPDAPPIMILDIDVNGLRCNVNDTGLVLAMSDLVDVTPIPAPIGACCFEGNCIKTSSVTCGDFGGVFRGVGTDCGMMACPMNVCPHDFDGNEEVGITDLLELISVWGPCAF